MSPILLKLLSSFLMELDYLRIDSWYFMSGKGFMSKVRSPEINIDINTTIWINPLNIFNSLSTHIPWLSCNEDVLTEKERKKAG